MEVLRTVPGTYVLTTVIMIITKSKVTEGKV